MADIAADAPAPASDSTPTAAPADRSWMLFYSPVVSIQVGEGDKCEVFRVARDLLNLHSPVFRAMLTGKTA